MKNFSVIISCYKDDYYKHFEEAINSIYHSSILPSEVILVVDGPISGNLSKSVNYLSNKFKTLKIFRKKNNQGLGKALKFALKQANYDLVARMDSDDINQFYRFEFLLNEFIKDKSLDVCGTFIEEFEDNSNYKLVRKVPLSLKDIKSFSKFRNPLNHVTVMFKKKSVLKAGGYKHMLYFEDYYLWIRMIKNKMSLKNIKYIGVNVRGGKNMIERRSGINYIKKEVLFFRKLYKIDFINIFELLINIVLRTISRLFGKYNIYIYKYILRK